MTLGHLIDDAVPRLTNPTAAISTTGAGARRRAARQITPELIALHSRPAARRRVSRAQPQDALTASANSRPSSIR